MKPTDTIVPEAHVEEIDKVQQQPEEDGWTIYSKKKGGNKSVKQSPIKETFMPPILENPDEHEAILPSSSAVT